MLGSQASCARHPVCLFPGPPLVLSRPPVLRTMAYGPMVPVLGPSAWFQGHHASACAHSLIHSTLHSPLSTLRSPLAAFALLSPPSGHGLCTAGPTNPTCDEPGCKGWGVKCHKACPEVGCGHFNHIMQKRCQVCDADRGTTPRSPRSPRWVTYGEREQERVCV